VDWRTSPLIASWWGEGHHPLCAVLKLPLLPPAAAFLGITTLRAAAYRRRWLPASRLPVPVVSVGNLTVGGTGKTPMVRWVAQRLVGAGRRTLIFSSGFGARAAGQDLDEEGASLRRAVPGALVLQAAHPRRALAAATSRQGALPDVVVLDDGFQKLGILRDLDIVMLDATRPFGSGLTIPAGPLRERRSALRRASFVVLSRTELVAPEAALALKSRLEAELGGTPVLRQRHEPSALLFSGRPPASLRGTSVFLLSAIAHPRAFEATVRRLGAHVAGHDAFRDHAALPPATVERSLARARGLGAQVVLCSTKDAPKLASFVAPSPPIDALDIEVVFEDDAAPLERRLLGLFERSGHAVTAQRA
jgi:tetraacyldisaccharide 4'-kinase